MTSKKISAIGILGLAVVFGLTIIRADAAGNDSSIGFKKDPVSGLFTLTIKDPDGIQEFSLSLAGELPYGGGLSGCPRSFANDNVRFRDPDHFTPVMHAYVIDCNNNKTELEIPPPVNGITRSSVVKKEIPPPPPPPPKQEEKKEGPLSAEDVRYPVPELGSCQNDTECRSYCDNVNHATECLAFAKNYHLISEEDAKQATDKFLNVKNGPGSCNSWSSCESYCSSVEHLDECIAFADETGYYSPAELAEAKKFQGLVRAGKQFPGGCKDRNTCELYCSVADHMEECLAFAEESGFMPKEEIKEARKFMALMRQGESPGGCASKEQCEKYCFEENHTDECIAFAEKAGVMSSEDAAMARKVGGKGPGGCRSKQQCESYCENNSDECFRFAQEHGLIGDDDMKHMREGMARFRQELDRMPPEAVQCMKEAAGEENFSKMLAGEPVFDRSLQSKMKSCFGEIASQVGRQLNTIPPEAAQCIKDVIGEEGLKKMQSGEFDENMNFSDLEGCFRELQASFGGRPDGHGGPGGFVGPGGCTSIDECTAYCQTNQQECQNFSPPAGGGSSGSQGGGNRQGDGFSECGIVTGAVAAYVCGVNGRGATPGVETTYFNRCHAEQHGVQILHEGACQEQQQCPGVADPVCGNDNNSWTNTCHAEKQGGGVKHKGVCTGEDSKQTDARLPDRQGFSGGPGGCKSTAECTAYCQSHPQECGGMPPPHPTSSCAPLPSGLVSWWDEDTLSDASGGVTIAPGKVGNAFKFDGASGRISVGNLASLNFGTGPFAFEVWFLWDGKDGVNNIIRKSNYPVSGPGAGYWLRIGGRNLEFFVGETTSIDGQPRGLITTPVSPNVWYHIVAARDDSGTMRLYVNGQLKGTAQASDANTTSEAPFTLGAWDDRFGVTEFFSGILDEATVYNRALGASDVQSIFNAGNAGKCAVGEVHYQQQFQQQQQNQPPANYSGPGGCTNQEECTKYCMQNYQDQACQQFMPSSPP